MKSQKFSENGKTQVHFEQLICSQKFDIPFFSLPFYIIYFPSFLLKSLKPFFVPCSHFLSFLFISKSCRTSPQTELPTVSSFAENFTHKNILARQNLLHKFAQISSVIYRMTDNYSAPYFMFNEGIAVAIQIFIRLLLLFVC